MPSAGSQQLQQVLNTTYDAESEFHYRNSPGFLFRSVVKCAITTDSDVDTVMCYLKTRLHFMLHFTF